MLISKELYLERPLSAGNYPVVIRVSHQGQERIVDTSVSCLRKHWDRQNKTINRRDVAYTIKNIQIDAVYRNVVGNIQDYLDKILAENLEFLLNKDNTVCTATEAIRSVSSQYYPSRKMYFSELIEKKIATLDSLNTRRGYQGFLNYFKSNFGNGPTLDELSPQFINDFRSCLENDYPAKSSMRLLHSSRMKSVINHGKETGLVSSLFSPKLPAYSLFPSDRNLSEYEIRAIYEIMKKHLVQDKYLAKASTLSLALFILDIAFQGIAPSDIASLKIEDLTFSKINLESKERGPLFQSQPDQTDIVVIKTIRTKTSIPVSIATALDPIKPILFPLMEGKSKDDYLIPCFDKTRIYTPQQRQSRLANFFKKMMRILNMVLADEKHLNIRKNITYYFARHAYCNLVDSLDIPRHIIQYLIGHRATVLERNYLRRITFAEQTAISLRLFHLLSPDIAT